MWDITDGKLYKHYEFRNFIEAFAFISKVALVSERVNHHPEIRIMYNVVDIYLCTHDEESTITEKDKHLAEKIDQCYKTTVAV